MKQMLCAAAVAAIMGTASHVFAYDWNNLPVPAKAGVNKVWVLDEEQSDDFNYKAKKMPFLFFFFNQSPFAQKWYDNHIRGWDGPGATLFSSKHSYIENGKLVLKAERVPEDKQGEPFTDSGLTTTKKVYAPFVTAKKTVKWPVYVEARMKTSALVLASNFWLLSDDDRNEIDVTETYGDGQDAYQMRTNYHVFDRDPVTNDMLGDFGHVQKHYDSEDKTKLTETYHRFGVFWKNPEHIEFYFDGKLVRTLTPETGLRDEKGYFFDREMRLIFDMEDHTWRAKKGITPSDKELADESINKMFVDWVRIYKPTPKGDVE